MWQEDCRNTPVKSNSLTLCLLTGNKFSDCDKPADNPNLKSAGQLLEEGLQKLPGRYQKLNDALRNTFPNPLPQRVFITEYPDITRDENENACEFPRAALDGWSPEEGQFFITFDNYLRTLWLYEKALNRVQGR